MFTATKFSSVEDKEKFAKQFKKFVQSDFDYSKFPKWFYNRLSMCYGMIAHYDQNGFYHTFFTTTQGKVRFLDDVMQYPCYGAPDYTFSDVEKYLQQWIKEQGLLEVYRQRFYDERNKQERMEYERLKAKFEPNL